LLFSFAETLSAMSRAAGAGTLLSRLLQLRARCAVERAAACGR
jgi:hypothetical protein